MRRDVNDVLNNNALGLWYLRRGRFEKAESYLRRAVRVLQKRNPNPNPYDGEPLITLLFVYFGRFVVIMITSSYWMSRMTGFTRLHGTLHGKMLDGLLVRKLA